MAIVQLTKVTLCCSSKEQEQLLKTLQHFGCVHLINLRSSGHEDAPEIPIHSGKVLKALRYLAQCSNKRHQISDTANFDFDEVIESALMIQSKARKVGDERDALLKKILEIEPWGDFELPDESAFQGLKLWFYCVPERLMPAMKKVDLIWQRVHKDNLYNYIVVLDREEPRASIMPVSRTHVGKVPLSQLYDELNELELTLEDLQAERESLTRWIDLIIANMARAEDEAGLKHAQSISLDDSGVFILQGWIPNDKLAVLERLTKRFQWVLVRVEPDQNEKPPTLLANPELISGGEELVNFYYPPGYFGWDPSSVLFFSFSVFFSMILSDAGYAALFGLLVGFYWSKLARSKKSLRIRRLAAVTVFTSIVWGVLVGSYFGFRPEENSVLALLAVIDVHDIQTMMNLSIAVGVAHIVIANGMMFFQRFGRLQKRLAYLGWIMLAIGGFGLWYAHKLNHELTKQIAVGQLSLGVLLILFFSSERALDKPSDLLWRVLDGLKSLTKLSRLFGDVLSYMRLFALGLASASMALIFNQLAEQVYNSVKGVGLLLGLLILVLGHLLNMILCLMSGLVHGLRLNFIEFYNWGVAEEGHSFKPFAKKEIASD